MENEKKERGKEKKKSEAGIFEAGSRPFSQ